MPEPLVDCSRFRDWLSPDGQNTGGAGWTSHLDTCADCRAQWLTHEVLSASLGRLDAPSPSPVPSDVLNRRLEAALPRRPLTGWRRAALLGYAGGSGAALTRLMRDVPVPVVTLASPWDAVAILAAVPVTLMVALVASRWLPVRGRVAPPPHLLPGP
ncbi:MAG TPA: hypothetical protein VLD67_00375 [Vicinamibacterales bacterium]|nr:hypothetical protein [Vicinamibacterales bacterium]